MNCCSSPGLGTVFSYTLSQTEVLLPLGDVSFKEGSTLADGIERLPFFNSFSNFSTSLSSLDLPSSISCFSLFRADNSLNTLSSFNLSCLFSSRALFLSARTLPHFSRQFAVQSDHHRMVFSICAALALASSSSLSFSSSRESMSSWRPLCCWSALQSFP